MKTRIETHTLDECPHQITEHLDECPDCGALSACICLNTIVREWEIELMGNGDYRYQYTPNGSLLAFYGYTDTYRKALDSIAHSILCEKEGKR